MAHFPCSSLHGLAQACMGEKGKQVCNRLVAELYERLVWGASLRFSASKGPSSHSQKMHVDRGCRHKRVTQEFSHDADVAPRRKQVRGLCFMPAFAAKFRFMQ
ncbi:hypothetical protein [Hydrogenophaga sp. ZJX-1]|uniref:hypothetical protein n=1 Tax=Hydrogenophaga sp. ZJX-1 TaxID=3404778 RepID=UPI003B281F26